MFEAKNVVVVPFFFKDHISVLSFQLCSLALLRRLHIFIKTHTCVCRGDILLEVGLGCL